MKTVRRLVLPAVVFATLCALSTPELKAAPGTGTLDGTDAFNGNLIAINPTTGSASVVGPLGAGPIPSLAVDSISGTIYAGGGGGVPNIGSSGFCVGALQIPPLCKGRQGGVEASRGWA